MKYSTLNLKHSCFHSVLWERMGGHCKEGQLRNVEGIIVSKVTVFQLG